MNTDPNATPTTANAKSLLEEAITALVVDRCDFTDPPDQTEKFYWHVVAMAMDAAQAVIDSAFEHDLLAQKKTETPK